MKQLVGQIFFCRFRLTCSMNLFEFTDLTQKAAEVHINCNADTSNRFYGNRGALRCLHEEGDVAILELQYLRGMIAALLRCWMIFFLNKRILKTIRTRCWFGTGRTRLPHNMQKWFIGRPNWFRYRWSLRSDNHRRQWNCRTTEEWQNSRNNQCTLVVRQILFDKSWLQNVQCVQWIQAFAVQSNAEIFNSDSRVENWNFDFFCYALVGLNFRCGVLWGSRFGRDRTKLQKFILQFGTVCSGIVDNGAPVSEFATYDYNFIHSTTNVRMKFRL